MMGLAGGKAMLAVTLHGGQPDQVAAIIEPISGKITFFLHFHAHSKSGFTKVIEFVSNWDLDQIGIRIHNLAKR
jgi:hypothetical protein